jgi:hypothetical protein
MIRSKRWGDQIVWRASTTVIQCVFDQIPNLQKLLYNPKQNLGGEGASDEYTPAAKSLLKKRRHLGFGVFIVISSMLLPSLP